MGIQTDNDEYDIYIYNYIYMGLKHLQIGVTILPNIWKHKTCSKPPTRNVGKYTIHGAYGTVKKSLANSPPSKWFHQRSGLCVAVDHRYGPKYQLWMSVSHPFCGMITPFISSYPLVN
jgi:hypothetical protein